MASGIIKFQDEAVIRLISHLRSTAAQINQIIDEERKYVHMTCRTEAWDGDSSEMFMSVMSMWDKNGAELTQSCEEIAGATDVTRQNTVETEQQNTSQLARYSGGGSSVKA